MNPKLTSICDICLKRGKDPALYGNEVIQIFAQSLLMNFEGKKDTPIKGEDFLIKDHKTQKVYEAFLQDYDGNELAQQQLSRSQLNQAVIDSEDGNLAQPKLELDFQENLANLGLKVDFQLNELDYIDRERIRAKYHYRCQYCGRRGKSVDHKNPVSLSHNNDLDNLILSCSECNRIKSNMPYELFKHLNDQIPQVNQKLVQYENSITALKDEFSQRKRNLAAQMHLKGVVNDPELNQLRKANKKLQDAIDSLASDYNSLRKTRENYFNTGWKLAKEAKNPEIV